LGKAYEKYNLSWMEDVIPWTYTDLLKQISDESPTPILTGEDIYLKEGFQVLCEKHAVGKIHPDLATSGGILETHKIGDMAEEYGVPMAMHFAGTPVSCMATVPDGPGLGITLNEDVVRQHLMPGTGYFEPTTQWDHERSWDRLWS
jgi:L-alanine-DL-glutamate epimerase-like enolase superfamily enzyme